MRKQTKSKSAPKTADFLLEIGCEELPADYMPAVLGWNNPQVGELSALVLAVLDGLGITCSRIEVFGTPRRLVVLVRNVPPIIEKTESGPPVRFAFDPAGKPTRAAEAFAQKFGVVGSKLSRKQTAKGECLVLERRIAVSELLKRAVPEIIDGISFPKTMRWDLSGVRFARPVRWLLALYGSSMVPCAYGETRNGKVTYGNRRQGTKMVPVKDVRSYFGTLKRLRVELEEGQHIERTADGWTPVRTTFGKRKRLLQQLCAAAQRLKGRLPDETTEEFNWLLTTVTFLAEDPVVEIGSFQEKYLDLPPEVLATSMAKHLKLFSVYSPDGKKLLPKFLAILEGKPKNAASVMANYDRIIEARFTDARFFYREDTKSRLEDKISELSKVVFHEKLGSVADRIPRLEHLMNAICREGKMSGTTS